MSAHNQLSQSLNHQHQQQQHQQMQHHQQSQQQMSMQVNTSSSGQQGQQKMLQMLPQHSTAAMAGTNSCQFSQPPFPLRSPQIMTPTFLEPPQYLTAIPVQPVIAPFPVAPVISPLPVSFFSTSDIDTGIGSFSSSNSCFLKNQTDMLAGPVIMTPTQSQLQEQLQRKHDELQKLIMQQQDELRIVSEQLLLARYTLLQPMMPVNYNNPVAVGNNSRNYNYNGNTVQPQFNQYGFAMNAGEMQNQQDQQMMMQQQHNLQQQMHQNHAQQQQSSQQLQQSMMQSQNSQHAQSQAAEQMVLNRPVPDLDQFAQEEFDAFLNLSPLHSMEGSQSNLQPLNSVGSNNNNNNNNHLTNSNIANTSSNTNNPSNNPSNSLQQTPFNPNPHSNEDSLLSYMQMAAETSPALNFPMGISDDGSESQSEDTKLLQNPSTQHLPTAGTGSTQSAVVQPQQQRSPAFYPPHNFQNLNVATPTNPSVNNSNNSNTTTTNPSNSATDTLPSALDAILPYPITQEQSPNLYSATNSTHAPGGSQ